jgi:hypothetical protein
MRLLAMQEGELGQREKAVFVADRPELPMQTTQYLGRLLVELIQQAFPAQHPLRRLGRQFRRQRTFVLNGVGSRDIDVRHPDWSAASSLQQGEAGECQDPKSQIRARHAHDPRVHHSSFS